MTRSDRDFPRGIDLQAKLRSRAAGSLDIIYITMANTYPQIYLQIVFAVKYRNAVIDNGIPQNALDKFFNRFLI